MKPVRIPIEAIVTLERYGWFPNEIEQYHAGDFVRLQDVQNLEWPSDVTSVAQESKPTDLSAEMRRWAGDAEGYACELIRKGADEIERYYGAMLAWKQTVEKKDLDWQNEVTKATDARCAARSAAPLPLPAGSSEAVRDVLTERQRQVSVKDWTPEHDDAHPSGEIAAFAAVYAMPPAARDWPSSETGYGDTFGVALCPEDWQPKFGDRRRELVKAGALILAEIERIDRAALPLAAEPSQQEKK